MTQSIKKSLQNEESAKVDPGRTDGQPRDLLLLKINFWRVTFIVLGGQKCQHDDSLGSCTSIYYISTLFPPTYGMRWLIDGKFRGVASKIGGFMSIAMFRGGRRQNLRGAESKFQYWILNNNQPRLLHRKGIKLRSLINPSDFYARGFLFVPTWESYRGKSM